MATPVGDPNVSLLPQPTNPVPIEPMRGGGTENVSLLPQPSNPVPIEPMRGGGLEGSLQKFSFAPRVKSLQPFQEKKYSKQENVNKYIHTREELWGDEQKDYDFFETVDKQILPKIKNIQEKGKVEQIATLSSSENTYIFFVMNPEQLVKIFYTIRRDIEDTKKKDIYNNYILVDATDNRKENIFSLVFKSIIEFIYTYGHEKIEENERQNIFFIYNKAGKSLLLDNRELRASKSRKAVFEFLINLEPSFIKIPFQINGAQGQQEERFLFITALNKKPDTVNDKYSVVTTNQSAEKKLVLEKEKLLLKNLDGNTIYSINPTDYLTSYIYITFEQTENTAEAEPAVPTPTPLPTPTPTPAPTVVQTPVAEQIPEPIAAPRLEPKKEYILSFKDEIKISLGSSIFTIRNASEESFADWQKGIFNEQETKLFEELGIDKHFLEENQTQRKTEFLQKRGNFLKTLVMSNCFLDTQFLLRKECESSRDFIQELYELKQIDRIKAITQIFSNVYDITLKIDEKPIKEKGDITFGDIDFETLISAVSSKLKQKGVKPQILDFVNTFSSAASKIQERIQEINIDSLLDDLINRQKIKGRANIQGILVISNQGQRSEIGNISVPPGRTRTRQSIDSIELLPEGATPGRGSVDIFSLFGRSR